MTAADFNTALLALLEAKPFRRFTVTLNDGQSFEVDRGNAVAWRSGLAYFIPAVFSLHQFDHINTASFTPTTTEG